MAIFGGYVSFLEGISTYILLQHMFWKILVLISVPIPLYGFTIILLSPCIAQHAVGPGSPSQDLLPGSQPFTAITKKKNVWKKLSQKSRATQWEDSICFFTFLQHRYPKCLYLKDIFLLQAKILGYPNVPSSSLTVHTTSPNDSTKTAWRSFQSRSAPRCTPGASRQKKWGDPDPSKNYTPEN